jgi:hypothetical protein
VAPWRREGDLQSVKLESPQKEAMTYVQGGAVDSSDFSAAATMGEYHNASRAMRAARAVITVAKTPYERLIKRRLITRVDLTSSLLSNSRAAASYAFALPSKAKRHIRARPSNMEICTTFQPTLNPPRLNRCLILPASHRWASIIMFYSRTLEGNCVRPRGKSVFHLASLGTLFEALFVSHPSISLCHPYRLSPPVSSTF